MSASIVFDSNCKLFLKNNELLVSELTTPEYTFIGEHEYRELLHTDWPESLCVYWTEMLARCHLAAVTSIYRSRQWVNAIGLAAEHSNAMGFAASLRGLIESAADTTTSLINVPMTLVMHRKYVDRVLRKKPVKVFEANKELEDQLIHFLFARKLDKRSAAPESHAAKSVREYLKALERASIAGVTETYATLCDVTHPGAISILIWCTDEMRSPSESKWRLKLDQEDQFIELLATQHKDLILHLLMYAFNPAALILAILNYFPLEQFHTPGIRRWNFSGIAAWRDVARRLGRAKPYA